MTTGESASHRALARVNVAAIERNCARLRGELHDGAELCAVVKADGYGHGAVQSARAALAGGASWLAVAAASEARELREAGLRDSNRAGDNLGGPSNLRDARILVMGALTDRELAQALAADADVVVWSERQVQAVRAAGGGRVHVKLDSGMGRLGTRDPAQASRTVAAARDADGVELVGLMTHFATADDPSDDGFFAMQLGRFAEWATAVKAEQPELLVHAANSAALLREADAQLDMVRCGIAVYGMDPFGEDPAARGLEPALRLSFLRRRGEAVRGGGERRVRAALCRRARHLAGGAADRLRRRLAARVLEQRRRADRRPSPPAGGHGEHGQHHHRSRPRRGR